MKVSVNNISSTKKELQVYFSPDELNPRFDTAYRENQAKIEIKGFRKGKVPINILKKMYGESIEYEALQNLINEVFPNIRKEQKIEIVGEPILKKIDYKTGGDCTFTIEVEIRPSFELNDYSNITVEKLVHKVSDEEIENEITRLLHAHSTRRKVNTVTDDEHIVLVDIQELDETGTPLIGKISKDIQIYLNNKSILPEVKEALKNSSVGETKLIQLQTVENNKTTPQKFNITIKDIDKIDLPELNDELIKSITKDKLKTVEEFRQSLKNHLEEYWKEYSDRKVADDIITELVRRHDFEVPESIIKTIIDTRIEEIKEQSPNKMLPKDFNEEKFREENRPNAIFQAKWLFIREKLMEVENIKISDEDFEKRASLESQRVGIDKDKLINFYKSSDSIKEQMLSEKLIEFLKEKTLITEKINK